MKRFWFGRYLVITGPWRIVCVTPQYVGGDAGDSALLWMVFDGLLLSHLYVGGKLLIYMCSFTIAYFPLK